MNNETKSVTDLSQPHEWLTEDECVTVFRLLCEDGCDSREIADNLNALLTRKYGDLKGQLAEARKDTERLNWMDKEGEIRECPSSGGYDIEEWQAWEITADWDGSLPDKNLRQAIDNAMKGQTDD